MEIINKNLLEVKKRILYTSKKLKKINKITIVAVSKKQSTKKIKQAISYGQKDFGESYVQEGLKKIHELKNKKINWHFIGQIQSNKVKLISKNFSWCHSIDKFNLIKKLNNSRPLILKPLNILIQVKMNQKDDSKSGIEIKYIDDFVKEIYKYPQLKLRGIMILPEIEKNIYKKNILFNKISKIMIDFKKKYPVCDILSLGMSDDFEMAILAGSNMLRIGTAIFGTRK